MTNWVSQEKCARLRVGVPYVKVYNPKHLCPKLNGYGDNGQRRLYLMSYKKSSKLILYMYKQYTPCEVKH